MNEPTEATHYQIELTSRQVLTALAVLLICLFAAFFAGVSIGRNAAAENAALELASVGEVSGAGERLDFFSRTDAAAAGSPRDAESTRAAATDSAAERPSRDAIEASEQGPEPGDDGLDPADPGLFSEPPSAADDELLPPEDMGRSGRRRRAAAARGEQPSTRVPIEPEEEEAAGEIAGDESVAAADGAAAGEPAPAASGFLIQVLATADRAKAQALVDRLVDADFKAFIASSTEGGRTVHRVRVGPVPDRALATRQAEELERRWGLDSWISPGGP